MLTERQRRVGELLRSEISDIVHRELRDPRLHGLVTITGVRVSVDLAHARVCVSVYGTEQEASESLSALRDAAAYIRGVLYKRLDIRRVPELHFVLDETAEKAQRIESIVRRLREERGEEPAPEPEDELLEGEDEVW